MNIFIFTQFYTYAECKSQTIYTHNTDIYLPYTGTKFRSRYTMQKLVLDPIPGPDWYGNFDKKVPNR
jgi:hypothetical protein